MYVIIVLFQCRWFCHFDDDVYVNVGELVSVLDQYNSSSEPVYLGRWPLSREKMEVQCMQGRVVLSWVLYTRGSDRQSAIFNGFSLKFCI